MAICEGVVAVVLVVVALAMGEQPSRGASTWRLCSTPPMSMYGDPAIGDEASSTVSLCLRGTDQRTKQSGGARASELVDG